MSDKVTKVGPDGLVKGQWVTFDATSYDGPLHGYNRSQGVAVWVRSYRNGKYTAVCANGYTFRPYFSDLTV